MDLVDESPIVMIEKIFLTPFQKFVKIESFSGILLSGVGFTMSIFFANLAFIENSMLIDSSKIGILIGSVVSGIVGYIILRSSGDRGNSEIKSE